MYKNGVDTANQQKMTVKDIGNNNKMQMLRHIIKSGGCSRAQLAGATGMSVMTVKKVVDALVRRGIVLEEKTDAPLGRKPGIVTAVATLGDIVCVDISSQVECIVTCFSLDGHTFSEFSARLGSAEPSHETLRTLFAKVRQTVPYILGVGVSVAGAYVEATDTIPKSYNDIYKDLFVKQFISECFGTQNVIVAHDVHMAAQNEASLRDTKSLMYMYFGAGVGGSLIVDGKNVTGHTQLAGETGSFLMEDGRLLNDVTGTIALAQQGEEESFAALWQRYVDGEPVAVRLVLDACRQVCRHVYNIIYFANPEYLVVDSNDKAYAQFLAKAAKEFCDKTIGKTSLPIEIRVEPSLSSGKSVFWGLYNTIFSQFLYEA